MTVAVVDTGVDATHPDLAGSLWTNPGEIAGNGIDDDGNGYVDDTRGWDFLGPRCLEPSARQRPGRRARARDARGGHRGRPG